MNQHPDELAKDYIRSQQNEGKKLKERIEEMIFDVKSKTETVLQIAKSTDPTPYKARVFLMHSGQAEQVLTGMKSRIRISSSYEQRLSDEYAKIENQATSYYRGFLQNFESAINDAAGEVRPLKVQEVKQEKNTGLNLSKPLNELNELEKMKKIISDFLAAESIDHRGYMDALKLNQALSENLTDQDQELSATISQQFKDFKDEFL